MSGLDLERLLGSRIGDMLEDLESRPVIWQIDDPSIEADFIRYRVRNGELDFDFKISETAAILEWFSLVQDELIPGGDAIDVINFLKFTTVEIPRNLYHLEPKGKFYRNTYGKNSGIVIGRRSSVDRRYELDKPYDPIKLAVDFTSPDTLDSITSIMVDGRRFKNSDEDSYVFGVEYSESSPGSGFFRLAVPLSAGSKAFNQDALGWVISVHDGAISQSPYEANRSAQSLATTLITLLPQVK